MKKQTRAGFLMSLLGLTAAPAIIGEVVRKDRNRIPEVPDYHYIGDRPVFKPGAASYFWYEDNTTWRVGDIGRTDEREYFVVTEIKNITRVPGMQQVWCKPANRDTFSYRNIRNSKNIRNAK